jgi:hypothetical protein
MVKEVNMEVPSLFSRILPHSEQQGNDEDGIGVIADPVHGSPTGINRIKPRYCQDSTCLSARSTVIGIGMRISKSSSATPTAKTTRSRSL